MRELVSLGVFHVAQEGASGTYGLGQFGASKAREILRAKVPVKFAFRGLWLKIPGR